MYVTMEVYKGHMGHAVLSLRRNFSVKSSVKSSINVKVPT